MKYRLLLTGLLLLGMTAVRAQIDQPPEEYLPGHYVNTSGERVDGYVKLQPNHRRIYFRPSAKGWIKMLGPAQVQSFTMDTMRYRAMQDVPILGHTGNKIRQSCFVRVLDDSPLSLYLTSFRDVKPATNFTTISSNLLLVSPQDEIVSIPLIKGLDKAELEQLRAALASMLPRGSNDLDLRKFRPHRDAEQFIAWVRSL